MPKHVKGRDRDKYYHLAKDQGFRARSAFKLIQIDQRFNLLSKAKVCVDLCAAPGGWCQVAARAMKPGSIILGVDILPIRDIRNVKTIQSDITTAECRRMINKELAGWGADIVLCDGAPDIGAEYAKDAYVQNELVLAALKTATNHLVEGGTFITKVYRSIDYNSLMWVFQHLFEDVQAIKPNSSRAQSSEIFIVCLKYNKPKYIDPKMLDPNHVFKEVIDPGSKGVDVLHKKYEKLNQKNRSGYDESLGMTLRATTTVSNFIDSLDPVRMLTDINEFYFSKDCDVYKNHSSTTDEIKICFTDLRVLGKPDFRRILRWRQKIRDELIKTNNNNKDDKDDEDDKDDINMENVKKKIEAIKGPMSDEDLLAEMAQRRLEIQHERKREERKRRKLMSKERHRKALGISNESFGVEQDMEIISASQFVGLDELQPNIEEEVRLKWERDERLRVANSGGDTGYFKDLDEIGYGQDGGKKELIQGDDDLEDQLEEDYQRYISTRRDRAKNMGKDINSEIAEELDRTITNKKARKLESSEGILNERNKDDFNVQQDNDSDDDDDDDDSNGSDSDNNNNSNSNSDGDSDDSDDSDDNEEVLNTSKSDKKNAALKDTNSDRFFSNPIFNDSMITNNNSDDDDGDDDDDEEEEEEEVEIDSDDEPGMEMVRSMPMTDKQKRKEKRRKDRERRERKELKKKERLEKETGGDVLGVNGLNLEIVSNNFDDDHNNNNNNNNDDDDIYLDAKELAIREQIRLGMGKKDLDENGDFEIVPESYSNSENINKNGSSSRRHQVKKSDSSSESDSSLDSNSNSNSDSDSDHDDDLPKRYDTRDYNSDEEVYDSHDRAMTLALGTMMLRKSRQKALVDASYNRYAYNDSKDLPSWFLDDEIKHNKPQVPVPTALLQQVKGKFQHTGVKDVKKVAEAKMRKRKRALNKLKAAKQQANVVANSNDMTDAQKVRAISRAMNGTKVDKPSKVYVVTKKTGAGSSATRTSSGKGSKLKFVDKRLRSDQRSMKRAEKAKSGKGKKKKGGRK